MLEGRGDWGRGRGWGRLGVPGGPDCPLKAHALCVQEVLNHILKDIEVFVQPLMKASVKKTKKQGKKKNTGPEGEC